MNRHFRCYVEGCSSNSYTPGVRLFHFPRNKKQCLPWIAFCKNPELYGLLERGLWLSTSHRRVCSLHFRPEDFQNHLFIKLLRGSVPSINGPLEVADNVTRSTNTAACFRSDVHSVRRVATGKEISLDMLGTRHMVSFKCQPPSELYVGNGAITGEIVLNEKATCHTESYECQLPSELNGTSTTGVPPAKEKYVIKYGSNPCHMIEETPELYSFVTLMHLDEEQFKLQWVYSIINGTAEQDRVVYESSCEDDKDGFVLIRDLKWDGVTIESLHLLALPYRPGILSLRDLRVNHLPLLRNIFTQGKKAVMEKYGLVGSQLHIFLNYIPSFYHLHVHFTSLSQEDFGVHFGKAHHLFSVISNLEINPNYYRDVTLPLFLRESDVLFHKYEKHGVVRKVGSPSQ